MLNFYSLIMTNNSVIWNKIKHRSYWVQIRDTLWEKDFLKKK